MSAEDVVKCDEQVDEIEIKTADVSSKFKFFETYKPNEQEKKPFRITPPRDGIVSATQDELEQQQSKDSSSNGHRFIDASAKAAQKSSTTTKMLSMFRQMEEAERNPAADDGIRPLKSFTPPPDDSRRLICRSSSRSGSEYTDSGSEDDDEEGSDGENHHRIVDDALKQAQAAARAKQLRAKFEKWESKEIQREQNNSSVRLYDGEDESQVESTRR